MHQKSLRIQISRSARVNTQVRQMKMDFDKIGKTK